MDACYVNGELVKAQPGKFYGGWVTSDIVGPFKGEPGIEAGNPANYLLLNKTRWRTFEESEINHNRRRPP